MAERDVDLNRGIISRNFYKILAVALAIIGINSKDNFSNYHKYSAAKPAQRQEQSALVKMPALPKDYQIKDSTVVYDGISKTATIYSGERRGRRMLKKYRLENGKYQEIYSPKSSNLEKSVIEGFFISFLGLLIITGINFKITGNVIGAGNIFLQSFSIILFLTTLFLAFFAIKLKNK